MGDFWRDVLGGVMVAALTAVASWLIARRRQRPRRRQEPRIRFLGNSENENDEDDRD